MRMQIYHTNFVSPVDYMEVNRYDLLFDGSYICTAARGLPYELPALIERFLKYIRMNPNETMMMYNKKAPFTKTTSEKIELIFDKEVPDIWLIIKEMIVEQKLKDIEEDFQ